MTQPPVTSRLAYLGPPGTFTEQALRTQADLLTCELVAISAIPDVLGAVADGDADLGFVAMENAIEGSVNVTLDSLVFDHELVIQREVVIDVSLNLVALPGTTLAEVHTVTSIPIALAQCRRFLRKELPEVEFEAATSTAEAARLVSEQHRTGVAAISPSLAAEMYGLEIVAADVEDHPENQTRFVVVARSGVPAPTGHDKTSIVVYQRADAPGSLLSILQEFAARAINLSKLESRPTKKQLGDYCFLIDFDGHVADEVVADCLRELRAKQADVKFLGSYPAAGDSDGAVRQEASARWEEAAAWVERIRNEIG
jgi:prephenate dehydratase